MIYWQLDIKKVENNRIDNKKLLVAMSNKKDIGKYVNGYNMC